MKRTLLALIAAIVSLGSAEPLSACTSAVISGKVTPDGRPLLWKNRDTDFPQKQREILLRRSLSFCSRCEQCGRQSDGCVDRYERRGLLHYEYAIL